jgi:hypothetical protein
VWITVARNIRPGRIRRATDKMMIEEGGEGLTELCLFVMKRNEGIVPSDDME